MKDLVEYIVKNLVTNPDAVVVEERSSEEGVNLLLTVDPTDMGLVIGKAGQTIKAIRRLVLIRAMSDGVRVNLELVEVPGRERDNRKESNESKATEESKIEEEKSEAPTELEDSEEKATAVEEEKPEQEEVKE